MPKAQSPKSKAERGSVFGLRASAFFRPSGFGLRASAFKGFGSRVWNGPDRLALRAWGLLTAPLDLVGGVRYKDRVKWLWPPFLLALLLAGGLTAYWWWQGRLERSQDGPIRAAARRYRVEPALIKAIVWRESRFDARARGRAEEIGLMQLREEAAREWAGAEHITEFEHEQCFDPGTNTLAGTWYLRKLLRRYARTDNPLPYALADYNAGRGNVLKWNQGTAATNSAAFIAQIGFPGTKEYVRQVIRRYAHYRSGFRLDAP